jgi:hypothetical protein
MLKGTYDYMMDTGLQYAGGKGVPESLGDVSTTVQTIRLPRDTIRNNNGLCIELALLWASVMEHVGIRSELVLRPGHAYICAPDFTMNSRPFTVECTAITPKSVGKAARVNFSEAVAMSQDDFEKYKQTGNLMTVDVQGLQTAGIVPPELPEVDVEKLKETLTGRKHGRW